MKRYGLLFLVCVMIFLPSCNVIRDQYIDHQFFAMDTVIELRLADEKGEKKESLVNYEEIFQSCEDRVTQLEQLFSKTIPTSIVSELNEEIDVMLQVPEEVTYLLQKALLAAEKTNQTYEPTIAPLVNLWNITAPEPSIPTLEQINAAKEHVNYKNIQIDGDKVYKSDPLTAVDLGGIAKGYACEQVIAYLKSTGISHGLVSFGGNVGVFGNKSNKTPWKIGIKNPMDTQTILGYVYIDSGYVAVSGDYERYFEKDGKRYHHIIDPSTGSPANSGLHSVAVVSENGIEADALSTALFVMGKEKAMEFYHTGEYQFEAIFITTDGEISLTDGLREKFEEV